MAGGLLTGLFAFLGVLAIVAAVIVFATRLATAPALTIADRRVRFFESWTASKGVFWHMLLSYLVVFGIILVLTVTLGTVIQLMFLGSLMPVIVELAQLAEGKADLMPQDVIAMLQESLSSPGVVIGLGIGCVMAYLMRITFEGMWHGVGAYNAVRYRSDGAAEETDAPVLGADHPAGASPTQD